MIQVLSSNYIVRVRAVAQSWLRPRHTRMQLQKKNKKVHLREEEEAQLHVYTINTPMGN